MSTEVYVGTSGWSFPDWNGIFYPETRPEGFNELEHVAEYFDSVEINTTFYRPTKPSYARKWLNNVRNNLRFKFTAKLWRRFTHEREERWTQQEVGVYREGVEPLASSGKLGALLIQFPWYFQDNEENRVWLADLSDAFKDYTLVVEVRHVSWNTEAAMKLFRQLNLNFCNIDQPKSRQSIGATSYATGSTAYYRFHGRNSKAWFNKNAGRDEKYDYLYSEDELKPWIDGIKDVQNKVEQVYIMANNHYKGQAPVNALQMKAKLGDGKVRVPGTLLERYPELKEIAEQR